MENPNTCKYFLRGTCRFGDRCRFYHPPGGQQQQQQQQQYFGGGGGGAQQDHRYGQSYQESRYKINESIKAIEELVKRDMAEWEKGKIWPFSCYGPTGGKPNLEGFEDVSTEELRYATMLNRGVPPTDMATRFQLWNRARAKWQQSTQANLAALEQIILGAAVSQQTGGGFQQQPLQQMPTQSAFGAGAPAGASSFGQASSFGAQNSTGFGAGNTSSALSNFSFALGQPQGQMQAAQTLQQQPGGMPQQHQQNPALSSFSFNSALQQQQTPQQPPPAYGQSFQSAPQAQAFQPSPPQAQAFPQGFASPAQQQQMPQAFAQNVSPFGQNIMTSPQQQQQSFAQNPALAQTMAQQAPQNQNPLNSFSFALNTPQQGQPPQPVAPFGSNFGGPANVSPFGGGQVPTAPAGAFGQGFAGGAVMNDGYDKNIYTNLSDLTPEEVKAFQAPQFIDADSLPLKAPAKEFCM